MFKGDYTRRFLFCLVTTGLLSFQVPALSNYQMTPRQAFYYHARRGDIAALQQLKYQGYSVNALNERGSTALCEAIYRRDYSAFQILRQLGASTTHECIRRIPNLTIQQFNEGFAWWARGVNSGKINYVGTEYAQSHVASDQEVSLFKRIYKLASHRKSAELQSLRLQCIDLDTLNAQGNTAYCQALIDENCAAYETLMEVGVNTNHRCVRRLTMDQRHLDCDNNGGAIWWWLGGGAAAAVGTLGIIALASGGGGGGGHDDKHSNNSGGNNTSGGGNSGNDDSGDNGETNPENSELCNYHGTYNSSTLKCNCESGFIGNNCEVTTNYCGSHGNYNSSTKRCDCTDNYSGTQCDTAPGSTCDPEPNCDASAHQVVSGCECDCASGYEWYDGACEPIIHNCASREGNVCVTCDAGYRLYNGACYEAIEHCATQERTSCITCDTGYKLTDNACPMDTCTGYNYTSCDEGWASSSTCWKGNEHMLLCDICDTGYQMDGNTCVKKQCPAGQYGDGDTCTNCPEHSSSLAGTQEITACYCEEGYVKGSNNQCFEKIENCQTQADTVCTKCNRGYKVSEGVCVVSDCAAYPLTFSPDNCTQVGQCEDGDQTLYRCENCNTDYILNNTTGLCYAKIEHCARQDSSTCSTCEENFVLYGGLCYTEIQHCTDQRGDTCYQCADDYELENNTCVVSSCSSAAYPLVKEPKHCQTPLSCTTNSGLTRYRCETCVTGYYIENGRCYSYSRCPADIYIYDSEPSCPTGYASSSCTDENNVKKYACDQCAEGYDWYNSDKCYPTVSCGVNEHQFGANCVCNQGFTKNGSGTCVLNASISPPAEPTSNSSGQLNIIQNGQDIGYKNYILPTGSIESNGYWNIPLELIALLAEQMHEDDDDDEYDDEEYDDDDDDDEPMEIGSFLVANTGNGSPALVIPQQTTLTYTLPNNAIINDIFTYAITSMGGRIYNHGTIISNVGGIMAYSLIDNAYIVNSGSITADNIGIMIYGEEDEYKGNQTVKPAYLWNKSGAEINTTGIYGIWATNSLIRNDGTITVTSNTADILFSEGVSLTNSTLVNNGTIQINSIQADGSLVGIGGSKNSTIVNTADGSIVINGNEDAASEIIGTGISTSGVVYNYGTIELNNVSMSRHSYTFSGETSYYASGGGIVASGPNARVYNSGTIRLNNVYYTAPEDGEDKTSNITQTQTGATGSFESAFVSLSDGAQMLTSGLLESSHSINLSSMGGSIIALPNAQFVSPVSISDDLNLSTDFVTDNFETTVIAKNMIQTPDASNLNLISQSALFDAHLADNGQDVVIKMKSFDQVTKNTSLANFLSKNYARSKNGSLFNKLKEFNNLASLSANLNKLSGKDMLSRFGFEDMTMMRELNYDMNDKLFHNNAQHFSLAGSVKPMAFRGDTGSNARYSLFNKRNGHKSIGLGIAFTNIHSDNDHNEEDRSESMYQLMVPLGYKTKGFNLITSPRIGYARGNYDRTGLNNQTYKGTVEKRIFGLMNEARYPIVLDKWTFEPIAEFNVLGYQQKGHEDSKEFALKIKNQRTYSVESGLGLYATREEDLGNDTILKMTAGIVAYHEFANPYCVKVGMVGMDGYFTLQDEDRSPNRGIVRLGLDYQHKDISLYGSLISFIDKEWRTNAKTGFRWQF